MNAEGLPLLKAFHSLVRAARGAGDRTGRVPRGTQGTHDLPSLSARNLPSPPPGILARSSSSTYFLHWIGLPQATGRDSHVCLHPFIEGFIFKDGDPPSYSVFLKTVPVKRRNAVC